MEINHEEYFKFLVANRKKRIVLNELINLNSICNTLK